MKVIRCRSEHSEEWEEYVERSDRSTFYHRIAWKDVIGWGMGHSTHYLMAKQDDAVKGILPLVLVKHPLIGRCLVSMPFLNYGGICADNAEAEDALLEDAIRVAEDDDVDYLELRQPRRIARTLPTNESKVTAVVPLVPEVTWKGLRKDVRRKVRRSSKIGVRCEIGGREYLEAFYDVFARNQRALGSPVFSLGFFGSVLKHFASDCKIMVVFYGDEVIAGSLVGIFKDCVEGLWAGARREFSRLNPNEFLYWQNIEFGLENGFKCFNLGRSTKDSGSLHFKLKFGAEVRPLYWQYHLNRAKEIPKVGAAGLKYRIVAGVWKRVPLSMTKRVGPHIRKYMPQ